MNVEESLKKGVFVSVTDNSCTEQMNLKGWFMGEMWGFMSQLRSFCAKVTRVQSNGEGPFTSHNSVIQRGLPWQQKIKAKIRPCQSYVNGLF